MRTRSAHYILGLACLAVLLAGLVLPLGVMLERGFAAPPAPGAKEGGHFTFTADYVLGVLTEEDSGG